MVQPDLRRSAELQTWIDVSGKAIVAEYRGVEDENVVLYFKDRERRAPLAQLSDSDRSFVDEKNRAADEGETEPAEDGRSGDDASDPSGASDGSAPEWDEIDSHVDEALEHADDEALDAYEDFNRGRDDAIPRHEEWAREAEE